MNSKVKVGDYLIYREPYSFTVTNVAKEVGAGYKAKNITIHVSDGEICFYDSYGSEDSFRGTKVDGNVYDTIEQMANNMLESIKTTKAKTFDKMLSYLEETIGDI